MIKTIFWKNNAVVLIDQKALPLAEKYIVCKSYKAVIACIKDLTVRGAPAIGVAAAMGAALGAIHLASLSPDKFRKKFYAICDEIAQARPTARNLFWALERMKKIVSHSSQLSQRDIVKELIKKAKHICSEDIAINQQMGKNGSRIIADGDNILTHCNAGALATAGYGTALGVIRAARKQGKKLHVYVDETRPVLQGARLTAWELKKEKIPYIYYEDMTNPRLAQTIAKETRAGLLKLNNGHGVKKTDIEAGASFISVMEKNLINLKKGLRCPKK